MRLRSPERSDAPAVLGLIIARDIADVGQPDYTLDDVLADWSAPGIELARDAWLAEDGDGLLGYALLDDRGTALVTVPPETEGRGAGTALREAAERRARERGEPVVRQHAATSNAAALDHLRRAGYSPTYTFYRMRLAAEHAPPPPDGHDVRTYRRGADDAPVHALVQAAMADAPGHEPRSLESWLAAKVEKGGWDPSLWLLHEDAGGLAGVALCEGWEEGIGYVDHLAVAARARGRGLGRALLLHAFSALRHAGMTVLELSVAGENASATRLYESVGMRSAFAFERWEKPVPAP